MDAILLEDLWSLSGFAAPGSPRLFLQVVWLFPIKQIFRKLALSFQEDAKLRIP